MQVGDLLLPARVVLVDAGENLGFAEGCNRGIERATGEWIATLNNDATATPTWIASLRAAASAGDARLGMVQSQILLKQDPTKRNSTGVLVYADGFIVDRGYGEPIVENERREEIFCSGAGAALYRRAMLDEIRLESGVFDRTFFMYFEDVDLGWRARLAGWSAHYVPSATVLHAFHGSSSSKGRHFVALQCKKNRIRTLLKNASWRLVAEGTPLSAFDGAWSLYRGGAASAGQLSQAVRDGLWQRADVKHIARVGRRDVERRWLGE